MPPRKGSVGVGVAGWARGRGMSDQAPTGESQPGRVLAIEPGRCPRCGEVKAWLRPGEVCAPCRAPAGAPALRLAEDDEEPAAIAPPAVKREDDMAKGRAATCEECEKGFTASPFGPMPKRCPKCKEKPAEEELEEEEGEEEELEEPTATLVDAGDVDVAALYALAVSVGLDPVQVLLEAILEARRGRSS